MTRNKWDVSKKKINQLNKEYSERRALMRFTREKGGETESVEEGKAELKKEIQIASKDYMS